jgi:WD40 repeat protein
MHCRPPIANRRTFPDHDLIGRGYRGRLPGRANDVDVKAGAETGPVAGHTLGVSALCTGADGGLVSGSDDKTIRLWDSNTGAEFGRMKGHTNAVNALCVLAGGRLASGSDDKTIRLWDPTTHAEARCLRGHTLAIAALCVVHDGRLASLLGPDDPVVGYPIGRGDLAFRRAYGLGSRPLSAAKPAACLGLRG